MGSTPLPFSRTATILRLSSQVSAMAGGTILVAIAALTLASVLGRSLASHPIQGDVEIVQLASAVAVACFLPFTQWRGANIIVDFFTAKSSDRAKGRLDALGALLLGLVMALVCWRTAAGAMMARDNEETSMLIAIPLWIPYVLMLPGLGLTAINACYMAWRHWTGFGLHE